MYMCVCVLLLLGRAMFRFASALRGVAPDALSLSPPTVWPSAFVPRSREAQAVAEAKALNGGAVAEEAPATEAPQEQEKDLRTLLGELMNALTETKKEALIAGASLPDVRERVMRKVVATERTVELETTFKRYDKDTVGTDSGSVGSCEG